MPKNSGGKQVGRRRWLGLIICLVLVGGLVANYCRPLPLVEPVAAKLVLPAAETVKLDWPSAGQAAIGTAGSGILATYGPQKPIATASIAKIITALCVLDKYPLLISQTGPTLTMSASDVQIYDMYVKENGSRAAVKAGEQLSEYQMLQGLLLPSANNMADSLAIWAFGSMAGYTTYANQFLASHGLSNTHVGGVDASGFDASTTSTASDLVKLALLATANPVLTQIASQKEADLPVAGKVTNYNSLLGQAGITGLKTGNNDQNPGAFLFSANLNVGPDKVTVVGAVLGQSSLPVALGATLPLISSADNGFEQEKVLPAGSVIANYRAPWGASTKAVVGSDVTLLKWRGQSNKLNKDISDIKASQSPQTVGKVSVTAGGSQASSSLVLKNPLAGPSFWWRLVRH
ncbi:MAG: hypothetical protein ABI220_05420 [Candidatus Saccharimonadales bacterium]